jgi:hypothetical protein
MLAEIQEEGLIALIPNSVIVEEGLIALIPKMGGCSSSNAWLRLSFSISD